MKMLRILIMVLGLFVLTGCGGGGPAIGVPAVLTVQVINAATNQPVAGARVSLKKDSQPVPGGEVPSDSNGKAVFNISTGDGYKAFAGNATGLSPAASPSIKLEGNQDVVIRMTPAINSANGLLAGSVKEASTQQPIAGVTVTLAPAAGASVSTQRAGTVYQQQRVARPFGVLQSSGNSVQTDGSGQFTFNDVPPGAYTVSFQYNSYPTVTRNTTVVPGDSTAIETVFMGGPLVNPTIPPTGTTPTTGVTPAGHVLMVDAGRAVELDAKAQVVWRYNSSGVSCATRLPDGNTVVADEQNHKVWLVGVTGEALWDMGSSFGLFSRVNAPTWIGAARDGKSFLITDTGNNQVIEVENRSANGWHFDALNRPRSATYVPGTGNILIADTGNNRVIEVDRAGQIVWKFDRDMQAPVHAVRLDTGNTLITDTGYNRVIMINPQGQSVWYYDGAGTGPLNRPRSAMPTRFGTYVIADTGNNRIIEVDRTKTITSSIPNVNRPQVLERF